MRNIEIDLADRFETILASVLALPTGCGDEKTQGVTKKAELSRLIRELYEAANGRQVETHIGLVPIAPPACEFLKATPFRVATQMEFLAEAAARLLAGSMTGDLPEEIAKTVVRQRSDHAVPILYRPAQAITIPLAAFAASPL